MRETNETLTHVNGWEPAVYSQTSQNFISRIEYIHISVLNFRFFQLMYPGSVSSRSVSTIVGLCRAMLVPPPSSHRRG